MTSEVELVMDAKKERKLRAEEQLKDDSKDDDDDLVLNRRKRSGGGSKGGGGGSKGGGGSSNGGGGSSKGGGGSSNGGGGSSKGGGGSSKGGGGRDADLDDPAFKEAIAASLGGGGSSNGGGGSSKGGGGSSNSMQDWIRDRRDAELVESELKKPIAASLGGGGSSNGGGGSSKGGGGRDAGLDEAVAASLRESISCCESGTCFTGTALARMQQTGLPGLLYPLDGKETKTACQLSADTQYTSAAIAKLHAPASDQRVVSAVRVRLLACFSVCTDVHFPRRPTLTTPAGGVHGSNGATCMGPSGRRPNPT